MAGIANSFKNSSDIHLWLIEHRNDAPNRFLSEPELARKQAIRREAKRHVFSLSRSALRQILATYLGLDPQEVPIAVMPNGKPFLSSEKSDIYFNLSHTGGLTLVGVASGRQIGVDVEKLDPRRPWQKIAKRFYSEQEIAFLEGGKMEDFFQLWTLKEAILKVRGEGLSRPLRDFSFSLDQPFPQKITDRGMSFLISPLHTGGNYSAAVAVEKSDDATFTVKKWPNFDPLA
ncbi:MAG: 4'-phosphopantetheinyl transferase superfamily protein [Deltaproteobacteria bacterium]|nr:4'-phosphopantetheinyl transferase superfamily protein [Deltaproteobacteria bacterium]